jgi:hypothetical protein
MSKAQRIANIADLALRDGGNGKGFQAKLGRAGPLLGFRRLGCSLTVVPPGKQAWPFHRHHVADELFYIVSGSGTVRLDDQSLAVRAGDLIANPAGPKPTRSSTPVPASSAISPSPTSARSISSSIRIRERWGWRPA